VRSPLSRKKSEEEGEKKARKNNSKKGGKRIEYDQKGRGQSAKGMSIFSITRGQNHKKDKKPSQKEGEWGGMQSCQERRFTRGEMFMSAEGVSLNKGSVCRRGRREEDWGRRFGEGLEVRGGKCREFFRRVQSEEKR